MRHKPRRIEADQVRAYYEGNTKRFLSLGAGGRFGAIHREVWGEGVGDPAQAFHYVNELTARHLDTVASHIPADGTLRILDMGSGVGGTIFYLLNRFPGRRLECTGVSIAESQTTLAGREAERLDVEGDCHFVTGDYEDVELPTGCDLVYFIESFIHAPHPWRVLDRAIQALRPGGVLVVCDDFLSRTLFSAGDKRVLQDFRDGWKAAHRTTAEELIRKAESRDMGTVEDLDLTPYLSLGRPRDRLVAACVGTIAPFLPDSPWRDSLVGGHAVQNALRSGLIRYRFLAFRKGG